MKSRVFIYNLALLTQNHAYLDSFSNAGTLPSIQLFYWDMDSLLLCPWKMSLPILRCSRVRKWSLIVIVTFLKNMYLLSILIPVVHTIPIKLYMWDRVEGNRIQRSESRWIWALWLYWVSYLGELLYLSERWFPLVKQEIYKLSRRTTMRN